MIVAFSCLVVLPLVVLLEHSAFISSPLEYIEVVAGLAIVFILTNAFIGRILRGVVAADDARRVVAQSCGLATSAALLGFIPGGVGGALLGALPFLVVAVWANPRSMPKWSSLAATTAAIVLVTSFTLALRAPYPENQVVFFGLDGATWPIIDELIDDNRLPVIEQMIETGARADLDVIDPVISPPLWTSIATGRRPADHGIQDFWASSEQVRSKRIWDIVDENGLISGIFGYLVTWPPEKTSGFLVPGWMAQDASTFPDSLSFVKEIEIGGKSNRRFGVGDMLRLGVASLRHGVTIGTMNEMLYFFTARKLNWEDGVALALYGRLLKVDITADVFRHLLKRTQPDFALFYTSGVDAIEHLFFKYFRPEGFDDVTEEEVLRFGDGVPQAYEAADRAIGAIMSAASPDANFIMVSDHGQTSAVSEGRLWYVVKITNLIELLGIPDDVRPTNIAATVYLRKDGDIPDPWPVRVALEGVLSLPDRKPLFNITEKTSGELRLGVRKDYEVSDGALILVGSEEIPYEQILEATARVSGVHTRTAVFLMQGPAVVSGRRLERGNVLDIAPTTLALLEMPVARDFEGRVIEEAFIESVRNRIPVAHVDTYGERERNSDTVSASQLNPAVVDQLKTLGYVE